MVFLLSVHSGCWKHSAFLPGCTELCRLCPGRGKINVTDRFFLLDEYTDMKQRHRNKEGFMADFDTLIRGGTIVDGTRVPRYRADIGLKNGKIAKIGRLQRIRTTLLLLSGGV